METIPEDNQEIESSLPALTQTVSQSESKVALTQQETPEEEPETAFGGMFWRYAAVALGIAATVGYVYFKKAKRIEFVWNALSLSTRKIILHY